MLWSDVDTRRIFRRKRRHARSGEIRKDIHVQHGTHVEIANLPDPQLVLSTVQSGIPGPGGFTGFAHELTSSPDLCTGQAGAGEGHEGNVGQVAAGTDCNRLAHEPGTGHCGGFKAHKPRHPFDADIVDAHASEDMAIVCRCFDADISGLSGFGPFKDLLAIPVSLQPVTQSGDTDMCLPGKRKRVMLYSCARVPLAAGVGIPGVIVPDSVDFLSVLIEKYQADA